MVLIKNCAFKPCNKPFEGPPKKKYCSPKCKKAFENSKRSAPKKKHTGADASLSAEMTKPSHLGGYASTYWDKVAPTLAKRGHLNVLSEDAFAELCDLAQRLNDINQMINLGMVQECNGCGEKIIIPGNRSLLQIDDKRDNKEGTETQSFKESALSDIKRKYSKLLLDYCKQFYLTPLSNRGNFGIQTEEKDPLEEFIKGQNGKKA